MHTSTYWYAIMNPLYIQITEELEREIDQGKYPIGSILPSLNGLSQEKEIARDTVVKAYKELLSRGIVKGVPGKGYYVRKKPSKKKSIIVIFDELSDYKKILLDSMLAEAGNSIELNVFFHHYNIEMFEALLQKSISDFEERVIMTFDHPKVARLIKQLDLKSTIFLDRQEHVPIQSSFIGQSYNQDLLFGLSELNSELKKYRGLNLILAEKNTHPNSLRKGFEEFIESSSKSNEIIHSSDRVEKGFAYLVLEDKDLVNIVERASRKNWILGKDIGVISYNETPLKRIVASGITTLSTDFVKMGEAVIQSVKSNTIVDLQDNFKINKRSSL